MARRPFLWSSAPTRASFARQGYQRVEVHAFTAPTLCGAITTTAGLIEWLLEAPEAAVGGLNRTYLLLMQVQRLRQLWEAAQRRAWPQGSLKAFGEALG